MISPQPVTPSSVSTWTKIKPCRPGTRTVPAPGFLSHGTLTSHERTLVIFMGVLLSYVEEKTGLHRLVYQCVRGIAQIGASCPVAKQVPAKHQLLLHFADDSYLSVRVSGWDACFFFAPEELTAHPFAGREKTSPLSEAFSRDYFDTLFAGLKPDTKTRVGTIPSVIYSTGPAAIPSCWITGVWANLARSVANPSSRGNSWAVRSTSVRSARCRAGTQAIQVCPATLSAYADGVALVSTSCCNCSLTRFNCSFSILS